MTLNSVRRASWVITGQAASFIATTTFLAIASRAMQTSQIGIMTVALTVALLQNQIIFAGINAAANRFYSEYPGNEKDKYISDLAHEVLINIRKTLAIVTIASLACAIFIGIELRLIALTLFFGYIQGFFVIANSTANTSGQVSVYGKSILVEAAARISFSLLVLIADIGHPMFFILCLVLSNCIALVYSIRNNKLFHNVSISNFQFKAPAKFDKIREYARPYFLSGAVAWLYASSDRWLLSRFGSLDLVGEYSVLNQLGVSPPAMLMAALMTHLSPSIYLRASSEEKEEQLAAGNILLRISLLWLALMTPIVAVAAMYGEEFMYVITGERFDHANMLPYFILSGVLSSMIQPTSMLLNNLMRTDILALMRTLTSGLGVFLIYISVTNNCGVEGVLLSISTASAVMIVVNMVVHRALIGSRRS